MRVVTYGFGMRSEMRRLGAAAAVVAAVLCLGACAPEDPGPKPSPDPTSTPLFASDEEALAAAEEAYGRYQAVSDAILKDGGANPERLLEVATQDQFEYEKNGYERAAASKHHSTGASTFRIDELQGISDTQVDVYLCENLSAVDILDETGTSVVSPDRPDIFPRVASFVRPADDASLVVSNIDEWSGEDFCES